MTIKHAFTAAILVTLASRMLPIAEADEAAGCDITYTRSACPGHEAESYEKCGGKQSCTKHVAATSDALCLDAAIKACANDRPNVTQSKVIHATYKGKALVSKSGKEDVCLDYAKRDLEFNQCGSKK